jgi:hypothetical protein|nr:MAG TPA: hypothetical protein [Caudoviricetes sp.]
MTFPEALQLIERKKDMAGTTTEKGLLIDLILVVPTDEKQKKEFVLRLMGSHDPQQAIVPFVNSDVEVWATNSDYLYEKNIVFYDIIKD